MAEFIPVETDKAKEFLKNHHHGVLATRRKNGDLQMSPVTCGLDSEGRAAPIEGIELDLPADQLEVRGDFVAFTSLATNLVAGDGNGKLDRGDRIAREQRPVEPGNLR